MVGLLGRSWLWLALLSSLLATDTATASHFPLFVDRPTLTDQLEQASLVLCGRLANPVPPCAGAPDGTTDLIIEGVIKNHDWLKGRKVITLPRFVPPEKGEYKVLVFSDILKDKIDPYRGLFVKADSDMARYLKGALEVKGVKPEKRLRFFFDYLDNTELEISNDAYKEFANASYPEYRDLACKLPAERIAKWLKDPKTPRDRTGLYALLLGRCGKSEHAALLRSMLDNKYPPISGRDNILVGYTLLQPKHGWNYLSGILKDPSQEFLVRYAALRAARFFWEQHGEVAISKKAIVEAVAGLLDQKDIVDLAIEDFRKWQRWDMADRILALQNKDVYSVKVVRRSILRYALSVKGNEAARRYLVEQRCQDPEAVKNAEELLQLADTLNLK